jgi:hypothetical protein
MTTSRIPACYQTRKTPDFAPAQQFAMDRIVPQKVTTGVPTILALVLVTP